MPHIRIQQAHWNLIHIFEIWIHFQIETSGIDLQRQNVSNANYNEP